MKFGTATELNLFHTSALLKYIALKNEHVNMPVYSDEKRQTNDLRGAYNTLTHI